MKVDIHKRTVRGKRAWVVDWWTEGKRQRRFFQSKAMAEAEAETIQEQRRQAGDAYLALTAAERAEVVAVLQEIKDSGFRLRQVWETFQSECVNVRPKIRKGLGEAVTEYVEAKRLGQRGENYVGGLALYLGLFARGREAMAVGQIATADIEQWFKDRKETAETQASNFWRLSGLFNFCRRRGYIRENPCEAMERVRTVREAPEIMTVRQAARCLVLTRRKMPRFMPYLALGLFAGVRPEELDKLGWEAIDLERGTVTIDASVSKVKRRRIVHLMPAAIAWLKQGGDLPLPHVTRRRCLRRLRDMLKLKRWPQDFLRHTAASYLLAHHQDAGKVALGLGNSAGVLLRHYIELVRREEAERFFRLMPR